ncbi:MAG: 16S rRNA (cytosine(1402)-N(4))-methyltransferase RsmH [Chlamydiae bacterium]|nr:16S rRNA (cytosine(1402)-N(4))-methyltransferase RsmH [Chlamydiota bacterium]
MEDKLQPSLPHISVMEEEMTQFFSTKPISVFVDATLGAGGHAKRILETHPEITKLIGVDQDPEALALAAKVLEPWKEKVCLVHANFVELDRVLQQEGVTQVDGCFFDLGVSSMQLDTARRGFSFLQEGPLDMRMNPLQELDAKEVVNTWSERELGELFRDYGEDPRWKAAAKIIVQERRKGVITTTKQLADLLATGLRTKIRGKLHPATLVFQALRLFVNKELSVLESALKKMIAHLAPQGIVGVISFHSLEDRIVKHIFREASAKVKERGHTILPILQLLTKKPVVPSWKEVRSNPRARSAKLRFAQRN